MRTQIEGVEESTFNGKFSVKFVMYKGTPGDEYVSGQVESGAVFATEDDAYAGGQRAMDTLEATGCYPNMCEVF